MRQILISNSQAIVARMPRPSVERGAVLVRVHYSLISTGTELAALRPLSAGTKGATRAERFTDLSGRAVYYLGKAARNPRKAAERVSQMAKVAIRRSLPKRSAKQTPSEPVSAGALTWVKHAAASLEHKDGRLHILTDDGEATYQVGTQPIDVPEGHAVSLAIAGRVEDGAVALGVLDETQSNWLATIRLDQGEIDETFRFDPGASQRVTLVVTNVGTGTPSRLVIDRTDVGFVPPDTSGLPVSEMGDMGWNVGYSVAGEVVAVGDGVTDLAAGDLVACAGAGQANHADYVLVKRNLVARLPKGCPVDLAATTTVGSIALQGVRRAAPQMGETVAVIGLGLIGMLTVQMLRASGCRVLGLDLDAARAERARAMGAAATTTSPDDFARLVRDATQGLGADQTIITAASKSNALINLAMETTRRKGRVVIVGDIGLKAERAQFYRKEIDLLMSTSYGPGRYDRVYEEEGADYPAAYVRWTLNRNMSAYLGLIADGLIDVRPLIDRVVEVGDAPDAYRELADSTDSPPLGVLIHYCDETRPLPEAPDAARIALRGHRKAKSDRIAYALVGAGGFGTAMLVPQMERRKDRFFLRGVVSRDAVRGGNFARSRQVEILTSDLDAALDEPGIDLVVIATRHSDHAAQVVKALEKGKHVFVEKPLALTWEELDRVREAYQALAEPPLLMVGFNRRFSPAVLALKEALAGRHYPLMINYRLNGGFIPADHWVQGPEGGGRNIGEACHMYDVFRSLAGAAVTSVAATAVDPHGTAYLRNDNFTATIGYADGSVGNLVYTAMGPKEGMAKERIEVLCGGEAYVIDDFKSLTRASDGNVLWQASSVDKGHYEELSRLGDAIAGGDPAPIAFDEIVETTAVSFHVEDLIFGRGRE